MNKVPEKTKAVVANSGKHISDFTYRTWLLSY